MLPKKETLLKLKQIAHTTQEILKLLPTIATKNDLEKFTTKRDLEETEERKDGSQR